MIYSVTYFNPIGNCDNNVHVEADSELEAALIAHCSQWVPQKEFDLDDYHVNEYDESYIIKKEDALKGWTEELFQKAKNNAVRKHVIELWKWYYKSKADGKEQLLRHESLQEEYGITTDDILSIVEEYENNLTEK